MLEDGKPYEKFDFIDSKDDRFIQISDVFVGVLSELFYYVDTLVLGSSSSFPHLSKEQMYGIHLLYEVLSSSMRVGEHLQRYICPQKFRDRRCEFLEKVDAIYNNSKCCTKKS